MTGPSPGRQLADHLAPHYWDPDYPLWLNLGYWRDARSYPDAGQRMARQLAELAQVRPGDVVLDVGCGFLEPARYWTRSFAVSSVSCVTNDPFQYRVATHRLRHWQATDISVHYCDATSLSQHFTDVDVVFALESAFQFDTRFEFFKEARQVLRPMGRIATADLVCATEQASFEDAQIACRRVHGIPETNVYDKNTYVRLLEEVGFREVRAESIASHVHPGIEGLLASLRPGVDVSEAVTSASYQRNAKHSWWNVHGGLGDFIVCSAHKGRS